MFENIEKALAITLLALGVKLDGENEQVKKKGKKICLDETIVKKSSTYRCIIFDATLDVCSRHNELHLR